MRRKFSPGRQIQRILSGEPEPAPERLTVDEHLYVHVGACPCPQMRAEMARLAPIWVEGECDD